MSLVQATLKMYAKAARDTASAMGRSPMALLILFLAFVVTGLGDEALFRQTPDQSHMFSGILAAFVHAFAVGAYLSVLEVCVLGLRRIRVTDIGKHVGAYWREVLSVVFLFWLGGVLLQAYAPHLLGPVVLVVSLVFNPVPEQIYQSRIGSVELLGEAAGFMQRNWPEWIVAQAPLLLLIAADVVLWRVVSLEEVAGAFGPFLGFTRLGGDWLFWMASPDLSVRALIGTTFLLVFTHAFLLWRGFLFRELSSGSRRQRAWRAKM